MNQEQFGQHWEQFKGPLKGKSDKLTEEDLTEIRGDLANFGLILQKQYGDCDKEHVRTWADHRVQMLVA